MVKVICGSICTLVVLVSCGGSGGGENAIGGDSATTNSLQFMVDSSCSTAVTCTSEAVDSLTATILLKKDGNSCPTAIASPDYTATVTISCESSTCTTTSVSSWVRVSDSATQSTIPKGDYQVIVYYDANSNSTQDASDPVGCSEYLHLDPSSNFAVTSVQVAN